MKKRVFWSLLLVVALLAIATPAALAYGTVTGQVNDANGNPWTHGGTVSCTRNGGPRTATIGATGAWSVNLSSGSASTCTIDPAAGTAGNPVAFTCSVPGSGSSNGTYSCGAHSTGTGPNAVTLSSFSGSSRVAPAWLLAPLGLAAAVFVWLRRR